MSGKGDMFNKSSPNGSTMVDSSAVTTPFSQDQRYMQSNYCSPSIDNNK